MSTVEDDDVASELPSDPQGEPCWLAFPAPLSIHPGRRSATRTQILLGMALVAVSALAAGSITRNGLGFYDWDTYERLLFLPRYDIAAGTGDGHVLIHRLGLALVDLGLSSHAALLTLNALGYGAFVAAAIHVTASRGIGPSRQLFAVAMLVVASPGLVALVLMVEDNVLYFAPLLLALHGLTGRAGERPIREEIRRGAIVGAFLAVAMLTNITTLIFLFTFPLAGVLAALGRRGEAVRVAVVAPTALAVYYLAHFILLSGAPIALHTFLPQALALQDFGPSRSPLLSFQRLTEVFVGFRAMTLRPSLHAMAAPNGVNFVLSVLAPALVVVGYGLLIAYAIRLRLRWREAPKTYVTPFAVALLTMVFPFFYEPVLIERWDMYWFMLWLGLIALMKGPIPRPARATLAVVLVLQLAGSAVVVAHQGWGVFETDAQAATRTTLAEAREHEGPVVLPETIDRQHLAHLQFHLLGRDIFLVDDTGKVGQCHQEMFPLREVPRPCSEVADLTTRAAAPIIDGRVRPGWLAPKPSP